jgi:hypothetical protein
MKTALIESRSRIVTCSYQTMRALRSRDLITDEYRCDDSKDWTAHLSIFGMKERYDLFMAMGPGAARKHMHDDPMMQRPKNHPVRRIQQAREDALEWAAIAKGEDLTSDEKGFVLAALDYQMFDLERGTQRLQLCAHGDAILDNDTGKLGECPVHGRAQPAAFGYALMGARVTVAVMYPHL